MSVAQLEELAACIAVARHILDLSTPIQAPPNSVDAAG
jgi:FO synthase